jgi:hypothetical protein
MPPRPVQLVVLLFDMSIRFVPHRKHAYGPPRSAMGIHLLLYVDDFRTSQETPTSLHSLLRRYFYLFVDDICTSDETYLWFATSCYGGRFTSLYVDDVRTSQETNVWTFTACYEDNISLILNMSI